MTTRILYARLPEGLHGAVADIAERAGVSQSTVATVMLSLSLHLDPGPLAQPVIRAIRLRRKETR